MAKVFDGGLLLSRTRSGSSSSTCAVIHAEDGQPPTRLRNRYSSNLPVSTESVNHLSQLYLSASASSPLRFSSPSSPSCNSCAAAAPSSSCPSSPCRSYSCPSAPCPSSPCPSAASAVYSASSRRRQSTSVCKVVKRRFAKASEWRRRLAIVKCCDEDRSDVESTAARARSASEGHHGRQEEPQEVPQSYGIAPSSMPNRWDVIGLGQAMVDFSAIVSDEFIQNLGLVKGTRTVVNHEERGRAIQALDGCNYKVTAGGSLSNTLVALARLGAGYNGDLPLHVAMTGSVGSDPLGDFYRTKLLRANVYFLSEPIVGGTTGTVIVCTTPDAQRTMLSYQGMSSIVNFDDALEKQISMSRVLVVEGYLWELSETIETIARACKKAKEQGVLVALTASDVSCVNRHREKMWEVVAESADILFTNADEARALLGSYSSMTPADAAEALSRHCPLVSVTDGVQGSYIGLKGEVSYIQPASCVPVDTCGAGDAYAAGVLFGLLRGVPNLKGIGYLAARVAAVVVGQQGTRLKEEDARDLATCVPAVPWKVEGLNLSINV
ncbi:unnamed protein product [Calypogeia fissa]